MSNEIYDVVVEPKLQESKKILTFTVLYKVVANIVYKILNLGTVIKFIKNKNIMKNSTLP